MANLTEVSSNKIFDGYQKVFVHDSKELGCKMNFGIYLPPQAEKIAKLPVIYWLSGLTCNEQNFIQKSGAQQYASQNGVIIVNPDTSPRGLNIPGDSDHWDFGVGAGFYVNASQEPWSKNYKMYNYITSELVDLINTNFSVDKENKSIMGHSMGGHGALICALKNPGQYRAVSVFSPICNPINCPWGTKAFNGYLGAKESNKWEDWDATELSKTYNGPLLPIFIEQGSADKFFLEKQLLPENFLKASEVNKNISVKYNCREGYDHSYFFIATFIENNIKEHTNLIKN